jgi:hypothetical protein
MQWFGESVTTIEDVFSMWSVPKAYQKSEFSRKLGERIETKSTGEYRRSAYEDIACELEDFMCAVIQ